MINKITEDQYNTLRALKSAIEKSKEDSDKYFELALKIMGLKETPFGTPQDPNIDPIFAALYEKETSLDDSLFELDIKIIKNR